MAKIKQLPLHEAQKIAAGEVIERPANVVKELIENALDADATQITLTLEHAGMSSITITDNGCGMGPQDGRLCIVQYATSKITRVDDLVSTTTFGFRGEALASIAAVSYLTIITKEQLAEQGVKLECKESKIFDESPTACNTGSTFIIKDLFYNVPARKKFLKKEETEWRLIQQIVTAFCLENPLVHFKLIHASRTILNCPATDTLKNRIEQVWDATLTQNMIPIESTHTQGNLRVQGMISNHQYARYDRSSIFIFVNGRWVKNVQLSRALIKGYLNVIAQDKFPAACIFITLDADQLDVNIHPRKEEVQFLHPRIVETALTTGVKTALENHLSDQIRKPVTFAHQPAQAVRSPVHYAAPAPLPSFIPEFAHTPHPKNQPYAPAPQLFNQQTQEQNNFLESTTHEQSVLIGQFRKTYLLLERDDGLFVIDQHAAHERILYEQFRSRLGSMPIVNLLFPEIMHCSREELDLLEPYLAQLAQLGIHAERFGTDQLIIQATPVHCKDVPMQELIRELAAWIADNNTIDQEQFGRRLNERTHAQMACKAAVKAGDTLTNEQMYQLIKDLYTTANRFTCPHGRPTGWLLNMQEIEKKFKRVV